MSEPKQRKVFSIQNAKDVLFHMDGSNDMCCNDCQIRNCAFYTEIKRKEKTVNILCTRWQVLWLKEEPESHHLKKHSLWAARFKQQ